jgi:hypothetical protein
MKAILIFLTVIVLVCAPISFAGHRHVDIGPFDGELWEMDNIHIGIDDGSVILTHEYEDGEIEITDEYDLYIDGRLVKTDMRQRELLREYHTTIFEIKDRAIKIGIKGAKIGVEGAKIGIKAIAGILKMIFTDYDEDDLEREMERATEEIELKAELLEEEAEEIEDLADQVEDIWYDLEDEIPEIRDLDWS